LHGDPVCVSQQTNGIKPVPHPRLVQQIRRVSREIDILSGHPPIRMAHHDEVTGTGTAHPVKPLEPDDRFYYSNSVNRLFPGRLLHTCCRMIKAERNRDRQLEQ
jgi:hypothetical protein